MEKDIRSLIKRTFKVFFIVYLLDTSEVINPGGQDIRFLKLFLIELFFGKLQMKNGFLLYDLQRSQDKLHNNGVFKSLI